MAVTLTLTGKTPSQTQFGLDTFTEHYKCDATADVVLTDGSVPQRGDAHPDYATMFVTDRYCSETGESASALDVTYTGILGEDLPPQQHQEGVDVQTASASASSTGRVLGGAVTVQFYAPTTSLSYLSYEATGSDSAADPTADITVISITAGAAPVGGATADAVAAALFEIRIVEAISNSELVATKYWQNSSKKTKLYSAAIIVTSDAGIFLIELASGSGYSVSDVLTFTGSSGAATVTVTAIGGGGGVIGWSVSSITFTASEATMTASGGSGSGCTAIAAASI